MKLQSFLSFAVLSLALFFFPTPTFAQGCYECDWLDQECQDADWHGHGYDECIDRNDDCVLTGGPCWGPDPERAVQFVRADGTFFLPATGEAGLTTSWEIATAESAGPSAAARSYERNCKGLITRRVYGEVELAELARRTKHLTI